MVLQSELAFRMFVRLHGVELCYTPMIVAADLVRAAQRLGETAALDFFYDGGRCPSDRPLIVQLAADDPAVFVAAARILCRRGGLDALDLNLGCPQKTAVRDHFGCILMQEPELCTAIVRAAAGAGLGVPVTCKVRCFGERPPGFVDIDKTVAFCLAMQQAGATLVTVHGRTPEQRHHEGSPSFVAIGAVKAALAIPVLANGGTRTAADARRTMQTTGADGVMSAQTLLTNPKLFRTPIADKSRNGELADPIGGVEGNPSEADGNDPIAMAYEYLAFAAEFPPVHPKTVRDHLLCILMPVIVPRKAPGHVRDAPARDTAGLLDDVWCVLARECPPGIGVELRDSGRVARGKRGRGIHGAALFWAMVDICAARTGWQGTVPAGRPEPDRRTSKQEAEMLVSIKYPGLVVRF